MLSDITILASETGSSFTQRAFYLFRKHELQPISRPVFSSAELNDLLQEDYYGIVIGSDQVWRKAIFP